MREALATNMASSHIKGKFVLFMCALCFLGGTSLVYALELRFKYGIGDDYSGGFCLPSLAAAVLV